MKQSLPPGKMFETRLLSQFKRVGRHLLIGEVSLESGYSLKTVEEHMLKLVELGALRIMTLDEKQKVGLHVLAEGFILVDEKKFNIVTF